MEKLFNDLLAVEDVLGVIYLSDGGETLFSRFSSRLPRGLTPDAWRTMSRHIGKFNEAELVYENARIYLRRAPQGFILVVMDSFAVSAMVRLNCDILVPALAEQRRKPRGLARFFK